MLERNAKMKYRGCNHPGLSGRRGSRAGGGTPAVRHPSGGSVLSTTTVDLLGPLDDGGMRRAESLDRFPPLMRNGRRQQQQQQQQQQHFGRRRGSYARGRAP